MSSLRTARMRNTTGSSVYIASVSLMTGVGGGTNRTFAPLAAPLDAAAGAAVEVAEAAGAGAVGAGAGPVAALGAVLAPGR